jgi:hypothetical protein
VKQASLPSEVASRLAAVPGGSVRTGPLVDIPRLLRDLGRDPTAVFAAARCDPRLLDDPESTASLSVVSQLLDTCMDATDCPDFGLLPGSSAATPPPLPAPLIVRTGSLRLHGALRAERFELGPKSLAKDQFVVKRQSADQRQEL